VTGMSRTSHAPRGPAQRKRPFSWLFALGLCLASGSALEGCLVPQSVDPLTTRVHQPPRIPLANIDPNLLAPVLLAYQKGPADLQQGCRCTLDLSLVIEEDDTSADLEARWFIDYDRNTFTTTGFVKNTLPGSLDNVVTRGPAVFTVEPDNLSAGVHVIEMVVAEQSAFVDVSTDLPNRAVKTSEGYDSAQYRFVVDVKPSPGPACPGTPPSKRTCTP
jgi:hypothetical protein